MTLGRGFRAARHTDRRRRPGFSGRACRGHSRGWALFPLVERARAQRAPESKPPSRAQSTAGRWSRQARPAVGARPAGTCSTSGGGLDRLDQRVRARPARTCSTSGWSRQARPAVGARPVGVVSTSSTSGSGLDRLDQREWSRQARPAVGARPAGTRSIGGVARPAAEARPNTRNATRRPPGGGRRVWFARVYC